MLCLHMQFTTSVVYKPFKNINLPSKIAYKMCVFLQHLSMCLFSINQDTIYL